MNRPQASKTGEVQEQELSSHCFFAVYGKFSFPYSHKS
jgi:hypothetical protein